MKSSDIFTMSIVDGGGFQPRFLSHYLGAVYQPLHSFLHFFTKNVQNAVNDWTLVIGHLSVAFGWQTAPKNVRRGALCDRGTRWASSKTPPITL